MAAREPSADSLKSVQAILDTIDTPAYARNSRFDVLAWNGANTSMFGDFEKLPAERRNIIRRMFTSPYHRRTMLRWEEDARRLVAKFRLGLGQAADRPALLSFVQEMSCLSEDFARIWKDAEVTDAGEGVYLYETEKHGTIAFQHSTLIPEIRPDLRIVIYLRADHVMARAGSSGTRKLPE